LFAAASSRYQVVNFEYSIFKIYNLASTIPSDTPEFGNIQDPIALLSFEVLKKFDDTFGSKRTHCDTDEDIYEDCRVVDAFTRAGYTLESNDEDEDGWAPLNQLRILQYLHSIQASYSHTIPLLETLKLNLGTFIILSEASPLDVEFKFGTVSWRCCGFRSIVDRWRRISASAPY